MGELDLSGRPLFVRQDSGGELYDGNEALRMCNNMIQSEIYFERRAKTMSKDLQSATDKVNEYKEALQQSIDSLIAKESQMKEKVKSISSGIKDSTQKLGQSLGKIESQANFNNLEKYVVLLERAASAMEALADLEKSGKLEKIANSLK